MMDTTHATFLLTSVIYYFMLDIYYEYGYICSRQVSILKDGTATFSKDEGGDQGSQMLMMEYQPLVTAHTRRELHEEDFIRTGCLCVDVQSGLRSRPSQQLWMRVWHNAVQK